MEKEYFNNKWEIVETNCFPNKWKVVHIGYRDDNSFHVYFSTIKEAKDYINKTCKEKNPIISIISK